MISIATLFSGGEGVGVGARAAGLGHLWGIEHDDAIAQVARDNGFRVVTADVVTSNPQDFETPHVLNASPRCVNFSPAKANAQESEEDIELAMATVRFIEALKPRVFTLENVWMYRKSKSWRLIADALNRLGYWMTVHHFNSADFGVPQTRKRMIVRAIRGGWLPPLPLPEPWRGWYSAIEDLLPDLPDSEFAPWQLKRGVQDLLGQTRMFSQGIFHDHRGNEYPLSGLSTSEPAFTITANSNMGGIRAFLATGQYAQSSGTPNRQCQTVYADEPSPTVTASAKGDWRAAVPGRVVRLTPRCLARLQTFPDSYQLPDSNTLAARIIGNAVPPLWYQKIIEQFRSI